MKTDLNSPATSPAPAWRFPWMVLFGLGLLIVSVGANQALNTPQTTPSFQPGTNGPPALSEQERAKARSVSFGFVDTYEGVVNLYPAQMGVVKEVLVKEGESVSSGAVLFVMEDKLARENYKGAQEDLAASELKIEVAQGEVQKHRKTLDALDKALRAKEVELANARGRLPDLQRQISKGLMRADELTQAEKKLESLDLELQSKRAELEASQGVDTSKWIKLAEKEVAGKKIQLEKAQLGIDACQVVAPTAGKVMRLWIRAGEPLGPNPTRPAAQFVSDSPRIVRAEITQDYAHRLRLNQRATINDDARNGKSWSGKVVRISDWYTPRRSMLQEPMQFNDVRTLEAVVEFTESKPPDVKIGQRMLVILHD